MLQNGTTFTLDADPAAGDETRAELPIRKSSPPPCRAMLAARRRKVRLVATAVDKTRIVTRVEVGGKLSDRKGVSLPDTMIPFSALTPRIAPISKPPWIRASTGWRCRSFSVRRISPRPRKSRAAAPW